MTLYDAENLKVENERLAAEVERLRAALLMVRRRWTFDKYQQPTHTWHDWADCKAVIEAALKG